MSNTDVLAVVEQTSLAVGALENFQGQIQAWVDQGVLTTEGAIIFDIQAATAVGVLAGFNKAVRTLAATN